MKSLNLQVNTFCEFSDVTIGTETRTTTYAAKPDRSLNSTIIVRILDRVQAEAMHRANHFISRIRKIRMSAVQ